MVERGLGVALLRGTAVADALVGGSLREIELVGAVTIRRQIVAVERLGSRQRPWNSVYKVVTARLACNNGVLLIPFPRDPIAPQVTRE